MFRADDVSANSGGHTALRRKIIRRSKLPGETGARQPDHRYC